MPCASVSASSAGTGRVCGPLSKPPWVPLERPSASGTLDDMTSAAASLPRPSRYLETVMKGLKPGQPLVTVKNLRKKFGERVILKDVTFSIYPKTDRIGILGVNGAGKSTLMK